MRWIFLIMLESCQLYIREKTSEKKNKVCYTDSKSMFPFHSFNFDIYFFWCVHFRKILPSLHFTLCNSQACSKDCKWLLISKTLWRVSERKEWKKRRTNVIIFYLEMYELVWGKTLSLTPLLSSTSTFFFASVKILKMHENGHLNDFAYQFTFRSFFIFLCCVVLYRKRMKYLVHVLVFYVFPFRQVERRVKGLSGW